MAGGSGSRRSAGGWAAGQEKRRKLQLDTMLEDVSLFIWANPRRVAI
jgi:hypothetical protein